MAVVCKWVPDSEAKRYVISSIQFATSLTPTSYNKREVEVKFRFRNYIYGLPEMVIVARLTARTKRLIYMSNHLIERGIVNMSLESKNTFLRICKEIIYDLPWTNMYTTIRGINKTLGYSKTDPMAELNKRLRISRGLR